MFHQDYQDPQARIFVAFPLPGGGLITSNSLANLDAAKVDGAAISAVWNAMPGLEISAGVVVLDTQIEQGVDASGAANAATFNGKPLPFASDLSATLGGKRTWDVEADMRASLEVFGKHQSAF